MFIIFIMFVVVIMSLFYVNYLMNVPQEVREKLLELAKYDKELEEDVLKYENKYMSYYSYTKIMERFKIRRQKLISIVNKIKSNKVI